MSASDRILIRDLTAACVIGVFPKERERRQVVSIDLVLHVDCAPAARSDDLGDALDYKELKDRILAHVRASDYRLIEALAASVADLCLQDPRVARVEVTLDKPGALTDARSVAVRLERTR